MKKTNMVTNLKYLGLLFKTTLAYAQCIDRLECEIWSCQVEYFNSYGHKCEETNIAPNKVYSWN